MEQLRTAKARPAEPLPNRYDSALRYLRNPVFLAGARHKAQHWRADRTGAHPDILAFERAFIRRFKRLGVPMWAHCVQRSEATQRRHFVTGVTKARPGESPHNHGKAVDLVHGTRAWDIPKAAWDLIGHIGKEVAGQLGVKVVWGGEWRFYDPAHWELEDWRHYPTEAVVSAPQLEDLLAYYDGTLDGGGVPYRPE